ncbi:PLAT/LH2 domain-containing protein [Streptomyces niveiscabiei]|nr:PLAT/LH2 domain-containing protein [Streptomyces niveiscabiei]
MSLSARSAALLATTLASLTLAVPAHAQMSAAAAAVTYDVQIHVCDRSGAGTDDNVYGRLRNATNDASAWVLLDKSWYNDFERNDNDTYRLGAPDGFGTVTGVEISKDGGNGLCLDRIVLREPGADTVGVWRHDDIAAYWLDQKDDCSSAADYCLGNSNVFGLRYEQAEARGVPGATATAVNEPHGSQRHGAVRAASAPQDDDGDIIVLGDGQGGAFPNIVSDGGGEDDGETVIVGD